jgi:hypothetical protein
MLAGLTLLAAESGQAGRAASGRVSTDKRHVAAAPRYELTDLGTLPGSNSASGEDINNAGEVVGFIQDVETFQEVAVLFFQGQVTDLNQGAQVPPGFTLGEALGINDQGQIVGFAFSAEHEFAVFILDRNTGQATLIPELDSANDINNNGQIVGIATAEDPRGIATVWQNGQATALKHFLPPGSPLVLTDAFGINDAGQVVGTGFNPDDPDSGELGFLLDLNTRRITLFPDLFPSGIGSRGEVLANDPDGSAVLIENGRVTVLDDRVPRSPILAMVTGINDRGVLSGSASPDTERSVAVTLTPLEGGFGLNAAFLSPVTVGPRVRSGLRRGGDNGLGRIFGTQLEGTVRVTNDGDTPFPGGLVRFSLLTDLDQGLPEQHVQTVLVRRLGPGQSTRVHLRARLRGPALGRHSQDLTGRQVIARVERNGEELTHAISRPIR